MITRTQKQILAAVAVTAGIAGGLWAAGCYRKASTPAVSVDFIMDTIIEQKLYGEQAEEAVAEISARLQDFEDAFSMHLDSSEICKLNEAAGGEPVALSEQVYDLLKRSKELSQQSLGAFDVTIAPLSTLWNITGENPTVPGENKIKTAMSLVDVEKLILDDENQTALLLEKGQAVDLGGIAKGAACDIVREVAAEYDITCGYVSIGGNMVVLEEKSLGRDLRFGVRDPEGDSSQSICAVELYGKTMATTGGYERCFEENGVRYHHVLDPNTGWPADSDLLSVTVISEDGTLADYLSTTLFVLGKETVLSCLDREDFQLIAVGEDHTIYCSASLEGELLPTGNNESYTFVYGERR